MELSKKSYIKKTKQKQRHLGSFCAKYSPISDSLHPPPLCKNIEQNKTHKINVELGWENLETSKTC